MLFQTRNRKSETMKKLITTAAILMLFTSISSAQEISRTQEYRIWSAEQMINRLTDKMARTHNACSQASVEAWMPRLSDRCKESVLGAYPILNTIREVAANGDPMQWAKLIEIVHKVEAEIEAPLNRLEGKAR
jgi:hypothetical protein